jgi:hypothetical protein
MKRFISLILAAFTLALTASAQTTITKPLVAGDTVVNAATVSKLVTQATDGYQGIVVHALGTKISGTVGGTIGIYGSGDGTNYDLIGSTYTATDVASQQKTFYVSGPLPQYIQCRWIGTGTMSAKLTVKYRLTRYAQTSGN